MMMKVTPFHRRRNAVFAKACFLITKIPVLLTPVVTTSSRKPASGTEPPEINPEKKFSKG